MQTDRESFQLKIFASEDIDTAGLARDIANMKTGD